MQMWAGGIGDERKLNHAVSCRHCFQLKVQEMTCWNAKEGRQGLTALSLSGCQFYSSHSCCQEEASDQINNGPMLFALLEMIQCQSHGFMPPQPTRESQSEQSSVAFSFQSLTIGGLPKRMALLCR